LIANPKDLSEDAALRRITSNYDTRMISRLSRSPLLLYQIGPGYRGIDLSAYPRKTATLDLGSPAAREHLVSGWSGDEGEGDSTWVWATGARAVISLPLEPGRGTLVTFNAGPFNLPEDERSQTITVLLNGTQLNRFVMDPEPDVYMFEIPEGLALSETLLTFEFGYAIAPEDLGISSDNRPLAVLFDWIELR
jgi:hypothetical protein